jgi:hypothetical protein
MILRVFTRESYPVGAVRKPEIRPLFVCDSNFPFRKFRLYSANAIDSLLPGHGAAFRMCDQRSGPKAIQPLESSHQSRQPVRRMVGHPVGPS